MPETGEVSLPQELDNRLNQLRDVLENQQLREINPSLSKFWMDELSEEVPNAIVRSRRRGESTAFVIQFADGALHGEDRYFIRKYFAEFGAYVTTRNGERVDIDGDNINETILNSKIRRYPKSRNGIDTNKLPSGSVLLLNGEIRNEYLIMQTKIDGVRIMVDGSVVSSPNSSHRIVRPMLLIDLGDITKLPPLPPEKEDPRKTWRQIHKREPGLRKIMGEGGGKNLVGNDYLGYWEVVKEKAEDGFNVPLSGDEIKVTPTTLKENPVLETKEDRLAAVKEAFGVVLKHLYDPEFFSEKPVVGGSVYAIRKMVEVLGMTPSEIMKDGEALADMCEYLKQIAQSNGKVFGPSKIMPDNTQEGDPIMELVHSIEDTWEMPEIQGFHFLTENRVRANNKH